ncbi:AIPR protein [Chitinophaga dinghuensis]|uniref:AIPR protein n=1 Tax=Chitinophaga dinghuensis TaxID=1539050 RepID=A0A327W2X7_9BACT|nr:AIPR family protein [Chitinophaga dinghuensis]RAJ83609.1 AIPR protein [Chitinophaga dinghuensis]
MELEELHSYRHDLLNESMDDHDFIMESSFVRTCMPALSDTKLTEGDDFNDSYCNIRLHDLKLNGYTINESGERLQLLTVNENSLLLKAPKDHVSVSQKNAYEKLFSRAINFIKKASKNQLSEVLQDSDGSKILARQLCNPEFIKSIDVIEVFLLSATATIEPRGETPKPKRLEFSDEEVTISFQENKNKVRKTILIRKRLIDLNFLFDVSIAQGNRAPLTVDFSKYNIESIQAANEPHYESYLCVLPGKLLADLYKLHSSRMLEKNVRSFLQLKNNVNKGIQDTIRRYPEKFIAFNNGLTITATGKEVVIKNGKIILTSLTDFQIVNGGQTTATIYFSSKSGLDISKVKVMAKVNIVKDVSNENFDELISKISEYSNAQSRVSPVDLRSRNTQLIKLKSLSESVITPSGIKWFFERAKGEFATMIRKSPDSKNKINKDFPKERRFTKEELAKYYNAWGEHPFLVKKGGEKVFRLFIEEISEKKLSKNKRSIDRSFYEDVISRIILFRSFEKIYGFGNNAIGQIRSAVVPYSLSIFFKQAEQLKGDKHFNLTKIWQNEHLNNDLTDTASELMKLMNNLIKKYSASDDYGEYSKKPELWKSIRDCNEIMDFVSQQSFNKLIKKYFS